jgi:hypothetical protein
MREVTTAVRGSRAAVDLRSRAMCLCCCFHALRGQNSGGGEGRSQRERESRVHSVYGLPDPPYEDKLKCDYVSELRIQLSVTFLQGMASRVSFLTHEEHRNVHRKTRPHRTPLHKRAIIIIPFQSNPTSLHSHQKSSYTSIRERPRERERSGK